MMGACPGILRLQRDLSGGYRMNPLEAFTKTRGLSLSYLICQPVFI